MRGRPAVTGLVAALGLVAWLAPVAAQEDASVVAEAIGSLQQARQGIEQGGKAHMEARVTVAVDGQVEQDTRQAAWAIGLEYQRLERITENEVRVATPTEAWIYQGTAGVALHVPPATMESFDDAREDRLTEIGFPPTTALFDAIEADRDRLRVLGAASVDDRECWILRLDPGEGLSPEWDKVLNSGSPMVIACDDVRLAVEKDTYMLRGMEFAVRATAPDGTEMKAAISIVLTAMESGPEVDVPEALFRFSPPEETTTIEYPVDGDGADVLAQYQAAIERAG